MNTGSHVIEGGDYDRAGSASALLKESLKKIGVEPADIRRAMIAAYEAEMNVVIHAHEGVLKYTLDRGELCVEVVDKGPGIADIGLAMKEGYSTAPSKARELGFGAGMGLPNIKRNADRLDVRSTPGQGTEVRFTIRFAAQKGSSASRISLRVRAEQCVGCMRCLHACPTMAMRVHKKTPEILEALCIDCTACLEICKAGALTMAGTADLKESVAGSALVVPPAFFAEFGPAVSPQRVMSALHRMGFLDLWVTEAWEDALREAVVAYAEKEAKGFPVISPVCPAVVNLICLRFPSLVGSIAPFLYPVEAARRELNGRAAAVVAFCPSTRTLLTHGGPCEGGEVVSLAALRLAVQPAVSRESERIVAGRRSQPAGVETREPKGLMRVTNVRHNMAVLDKAENGLLGDIRVLELYACDGGCFGSPLLNEDAYIGHRRWEKARLQTLCSGSAVRRDAPFAARSGLRLDRNVSRAMAKLSEMEEVVRRLPGRDCGLCGAPTCSAMAEDIVMGRAYSSECVHLSDTQEKLA